jgi:NitT/TauT family transport system permease protein
MKSRFVSIALPPALTLIVTTLTAELVIRAAAIPPILLPTPSSVVHAAWEQWDSLGPALATTTTGVLLGLGLSAAGGVLIAIALSSSRWIERAFYPYAVLFQVVPIVAIAPLLVIWFGYGLRSVVAAAFIVSIFPVIANTLAGLLSVDPALRDLLRVYGASPLAALWKLKLPTALPHIFTGLRIASGLAVIGAIVGEFVGGGGLGSIVSSAIRQSRTDIVFAAVLYASLLGLALFAAVSLVSRWTLRNWHASAQP